MVYSPSEENDMSKLTAARRVEEFGWWGEEEEGLEGVGRRSTARRSQRR